MDIVKRMRRRNAFVSVMGDPHWTLTADPDPDCQDAAAEIERLREENERLKSENTYLTARVTLEGRVSRARAALSSKTEE